jgi:hypothetical protein
MSEYQYYEFQAIDKPLNAKQMAELRSYSTRAQITPASFINEYNWGNFKGNSDRWMDLRDLESRTKSGEFATRVQMLRRANASKPPFIKRLDEAGFS